MTTHWIKVRVRLIDDPAVLQMSERLGLSAEAVVGHLIRVWSWATDQLIDGNADGVTPALLDRISGVQGFSAAMQSVAWLDINAAGLTFPNWERHLASGAKERALTQARVSRHRSNASGVTKALPEKEKEREKEEDGKRSAGTDPPAIQSDIDAQQVRAFEARAKRGVSIERWLQHWADRGRASPEFVQAATAFYNSREESGKPITNSSVGSLIAACEGFSDAAVVSDMKRAAAGGFAILRPREQTDSKPNASSLQQQGARLMDKWRREGKA